MNHLCLLKLNDHLRCFFMLLIVLGPFQTDAVQASQQQDESEQGSAEVVEPDSLSEVPEKVDVKPVARDEEIENRLNEILKATKRFSAPEARVENGVAFLSGEAKVEEFKQWATDLASSTQDVAAVVNRMTVAEKSMWDFSQAFAELRQFRNGSIQAIPIILFGLVILVATWLVAKIAGWIANRLLNRRIPNSLLRWVATRALMLPILIFGIYLILRISGLTQLALTVLGGTGLLGLIIGIAFQDIAENFLASILISVQKPFRIGDLILVEGHEGIVQRVTTRGTTLLTVEGNHVQIPNSKIYKATIENYTANPLRRVSFDLGIGYDDSTTEAQILVLSIMKEHSAILNDPPPRVLLQELGAATVNLRALFWIDGTKNNWLSVRSSCMRIAKQSLLRAGISMPDEAREVIFPKGVPVHMAAQTDVSDQPVADSSPSHLKSDLSTQTTAHQPHSKPPQTRAQASELDTSEAEGHMQSDVDDLQRQAKQSWLPGEGEEVLVSEESN